jgi:hypothetical protein
MSMLDILDAIVFGALVLVAGLLSTEDLVRLSRKGSVWHAMPRPAGQRFRNNFALAWVSVFWLTVIWGNIGAVCAAAAIMTATFAWNLWGRRCTGAARTPRSGANPLDS